MTHTDAFPENNGKRNILGWIVLAGVVAGTLDILYAIGIWSFKGVTAQQVLQAVASGVLGKASFSGGGKAALLGLGLHMLIALAMAAVYFIAARKWPILIYRPWLYGTLYGVLLYAVMNFVVVPLSAAEVGGAKDTASFLLALLPHIVLMGWPIAWLARFALHMKI